MSFHFKLEKADNSSYEFFFIFLERIIFILANPKHYFTLSYLSPTFQYDSLTISAQYLLVI